MRIVVCGGRNFADRGAVGAALHRLKPKPGEPAEHVIIHGGATGADSMVRDWVEVFGGRQRIFPADWQQHGKSAGPIRNQRMLDEGKPDLVIAFPGGRGTADMVARAEAAGVRVLDLRS